MNENEADKTVLTGALRELMRRNSQLSSMVILLSYICDKNKCNGMLTVGEACEQLGISISDFKEARKRGYIGPSAMGEYSVFELAMLPEQLRRRATNKKLAEL